MHESSQIQVCPVTVSKEVCCGEDVVLTLRITYPCFTSKAFPGAAAAMNRHYSAAARRCEQNAMASLLPQAIRDRKESLAQGYPIHRYDIVREFQVTCNSGCILSLYTDTYQYTGGAHGSTRRTSETWDLTRCRTLSLAGLCRRGSNALRALPEDIIRRIAQMPDGDVGYFEDYPKLVRRTFNPCSFYLSDEGLCVYFQQYDIAPYAAGIQVFCFPREECGCKPQ